MDFPITGSEVIVAWYHHSMSEKKYPYPFVDEVLQNRDVEGGRQKSAELGRWYFIKENPQNVEKSTSFQIKLEPNALTFVDTESGVIKLSIMEIDNTLSIHGGIYNPQKGTETLKALIDILKYVAQITKKKVEYTTNRMNRTTHLAQKLQSLGFSPFIDTFGIEEFVLTLEPTAQPIHTYPELQIELMRLGFLKE
jgi:hypothetical protein